jgi:CIC family chloride channel protein
MFVLEEVRRDFQPVVFGAVFVAAIIADVISRLGSGPMPVFSVPNYPTPPISSLPIFALMGIIVGGLGVLFNKTLMLTTRLYSQVPARFTLLAAGITGGIIGLVGWFYPALIGSGGQLAESALNGELLLLAIPLFFAVRFLFTATSYGTGVPGGIFAPLLVQGALAGLAVGLIFHNLTPSVVPVPAIFAVVGMAAYFAAIVRAPLTGIMLIVEMTGNYSQMLSLLVACFCSYAVAELLKDLPIYEALLERDLKRAGSKIRLEKPVVMDFTVENDAPFAGKPIRSLGLPAGCIIVRCSDGKREWVPRADTRLVPHMRITAVIAPEATEAIELLHEGCKTPLEVHIEKI